MATYQLSFDAEDDIFNIATYTAERWGARQTLRYTNQLEQCMEQLAALEGVYRELKEFSPPVLVKHCQHYYIFGQQSEDQLMVIAVLHERMDMISRLQNRLGG